MSGVEVGLRWGLGEWLGSVRHDNRSVGVFGGGWIVVVTRVEGHSAADLRG